MRRAALLLVLVALSGLAIAGAAAPGSAAGGVVRPPVVVVGVGGLTWGEVTPQNMPTLWRLLDGGAAAGASTLVSASGAACPSDGWLSLSAGNVAGRIHRLRNGTVTCVPPEVARGPNGTATVPSWAALRSAQSGNPYSSQLGLLGPALSGHGGCATAVGPGAAWALADPQGRVARYATHESPSVFGCPVTVVDAGAVSQFGRTAELHVADAILARVLADAPHGATVIVAGISYVIGARANLGVMLAAGPGVSRDYLTSDATRWNGVVRLLDLPATLTDAAGVPTPGQFTGSPLTLSGQRPGGAATVDALQTLVARNRVISQVAGAFQQVLGVAALGLLLIAFALLRRRAMPARTWSRWAERLAWVVTGVPVSCFLVTLTRWWELPAPRVFLWVFMCVIALAIGVLTTVVGGPVWRKTAIPTGITFIVLVLDAFAGTPLHRGSPLGPSPLSGGRYYGYGNPTFGVFAVAAFFFAASVAMPLVQRGRTRPAAVLATGIALFAALVDLWPTLGADIGGGLALVPAAIVMGLAVLGLRLTWVRAAIACLVGVGLVTVVSVLDWLRPAGQRSHAGRFVQSVLDGTAQDTVLRKADYAVRSFTAGVPAFVSLLALIAVIVVYARSDRFAPAALTRTERDWPTLRPAMMGVVVLSVLGVLGNDYGIRIATFTLSVTFPLLVASCLSTHRDGVTQQGSLPPAPAAVTATADHEATGGPA
ncbi:MAG: hypothetical protein ACRDP1_10660 [Nocardioidaceae bacterium]